MVPSLRRRDGLFNARRCSWTGSKIGKDRNLNTMTETSMPSLFLLAADASATITSREFDWPDSPLRWLLLLGGGVALSLWVVWLYVRDTRDLSVGWKLWLTALRLGVLAGLLVIALNPSDRTQKQAFRPSRVAVLVDTSLSMRHPAEAPAADGSPGAGAAAGHRGPMRRTSCSRRQSSSNDCGFSMRSACSRLTRRWPGRIGFIRSP